jgi:putative oxidoreductase
MVEQRELFQVQSVATRKLRLKPAVGSLAQLRVTFLLRLSLATIFFWFGLLKLAGVSPVVDLLRNSIPFLARSPYIELLGLAEIVIAIGLVIERLANQAATLMILHLFCTLSIAIIAPTIVFAPVFPVLTLDGEFLAKNFVLITAGLVVISRREPRKQT